MRKIATKLTPKIKEYIWDVFNTRSYQEDPEECFFHFPNYENHVGFLNGSHSDHDVQKDYEEVDGDAFIREVNEYRQKGVKELENAGIIGEEPKMREFDTGATRNIDDNKLDFEGFVSPLALEEFAKYMHEHRMQADGKLRDSDNWQKGIPQDQYMKSMWRHFFDTWKNHRGHKTQEDQIKNLCGLMFNVQGYLHELLKQK